MTIVVHKGVDLDAFGSALALAHVFGGKMFLPEPKNRNVARLSHAVQEWVTDSVEGNVIFCDTDSLGTGKQSSSLITMAQYTAQTAVR